MQLKIGQAPVVNELLDRGMCITLKSRWNISFAELCHLNFGCSSGNLKDSNALKFLYSHEILIKHIIKHHKFMEILFTQNPNYFTNKIGLYLHTEARNIMQIKHISV